MGREQHYAGLHYRSKYQIGATHTSYDEDDYYDGSKKEFQFNHPRTPRTITDYGFTQTPKAE